MTTSCTTQKIPIPTDSYDHLSCDAATLTSIKTLITCFDTTMDSFHESIDTISNRLDLLTERTMRIQNRLNSSQNQIEEEGEKNKNQNPSQNPNENGMDIAKVTYPALYEHATQLKNIKSTLYRHSSAITIAKQKANDAVKLLLLQEVNNHNSDSDDSDDSDGDIDDKDDNNVKKEAAAKSSTTSNFNDDDDDEGKEQNRTTSATAKPSDEWLDRPSAFEERSNCNTAIQIDTVPPLLHKNSVKTIQKQSLLLSSEQIMGKDTKMDNINHEKKIKEDIIKEETLYYQKRLNEEQDEIATASNSSTVAIVDSMNLKQAVNSLTLDYYDDNMSVMSEFTRGPGGGIHNTNQFNIVGASSGDNNTLASSTYSTVSYGTTSASRRRRQRKIIAMAAAAAASSSSPPSSPSSSDKITIKDDHDLVVEPSSTSTTSSRQQIFSGSLPYVCDLLHDTYGLVDGKYGHVYPPVDNVHDLLVHDGGDQNVELAYEHHDKGLQHLYQQQLQQQQQQQQQKQAKKEIKIDATKHSQMNTDAMKRVEDSSSSLERKMGLYQLVEEGAEE